MNNLAFKKEILDYINSKYEEFEKYQSITLDIFKVFHQICVSNCIDYSMAFGTLLGAIRDKQQIPWDYDIDVFVPIQHKDLLLQVLNEKLPHGYYYKYTDNTYGYPAECLRVCKEGYTYMAIHVDVFFIVGCPQSNKSIKIFANDVSVLAKTRNIMFRHLHSSKQSNVFEKIYRLRYLFMSDKKLKSREDELCNKYPLESSEFCMIYAGDKLVYPTSIFSKYIEIPFGNISCRVMSGYDEFLKIKFKDYHQYLPIEARFNEFYKMLKIVRERQLNFTNNELK